MAEGLSQNLKRPFIIENRPGVAGNVGTEAVAKSAADGYTLLLVLDTPLTVNPSLYTKLPFDPERDLVPISLIASFSQMLVVHPSVAANSLADFVALAKHHRLTYGSGGTKGSPGHLAMEAFRMRAGFDIVHVAYKGNPQVVADLTGGHIQAGFLATPSVIELVREGKLRGLAVSGSHRTPHAPYVPTVAEADYPDFEMEFFEVLLGPSGMPPAIRALLEAQVRRVVGSPNFQERVRAQDLEPIGTNGVDARDRLKLTAARWKAVIKATNIQPD